MKEKEMIENRDVGGRKDRHGHSLDEVEVTCAECGERAKLVNGGVMYPHRPDLGDLLFYLCRCGASVGTHKGTREPLGTPANARTKSARSAAHAAFDPLWKASDAKRNGEGNARKRGYRWLAGELQIPFEECHIGMMSAAVANRVREICLPHLERLGIEPEERRGR